jgi:signal transduction histidine kinase
MHLSTRQLSPAIVLALAAMAAAVLLIDQIRYEEWADAAGLTISLAALLIGIRAVLLAERRHARAGEAAASRARRDAELFDHMMRMLDEEREAIAHRLHDGPLQVMAAIRLMADAARRALDEGDERLAHETLERLEQHAATVSNDLRRTTGRLHPVVLEQRGLLPALESLADSVREEYATDAALAAPDGTWDGDAERDLALYQLAREAAVAAARAGASAVRIVVARDGEAVRLVVAADGADDALGSQAEARTQLMAARAARIGASFELEDGSTRLVVRAPA